MQFVWLLVVVAVVAVSGPLVWSGPFAPAVGECQTPWQDCGSTHVKINNVHVENCCATPCKVAVGKTTTFSFTFTPDQDYPYLNQSACGELTPTNCIKFPKETFGAMCDCPVCKLNESCPFAAGVTVNITVNVYLEKVFPKHIQTIAKWQIFDPTKTQVGCFEVPVETV